ncbi:hypothetical protein RHMOL_Rhmol05G0189100 [Rhododendron molle]|uniref:Uncharacterized protein n=1 Tax=Rhododendron molle TaxID=49168 RepID=A0ACC0NSS5_RHOML|nr:hypothetical protein RHMOL_Rhmol05G0189100 [Rhododendron molle]
MCGLCVTRQVRKRRRAPRLHVGSELVLVLFLTGPRVFPFQVRDGTWVHCRV